jgi:predicted naringenin-chalcone synthase
MPHRKIDFQDMDWKTEHPGLRYKQRRVGSHKIRVLEVTDEYVDKEWSELQHTGYVVSGRIQFVFRDKTIEYTAGDGIVVTRTATDRYKAQVPKGEKAVLVFFEPN